MTQNPVSWQTLVPGELPTKTVELFFDNSNLRESLGTSNFAGLAELRWSDLPVSRQEAYKENASYYMLPRAAERVIADQNHFGPAFFIEIGDNSITIEDYCYGDKCLETSMKMLRHLVVELDLKCRWKAYSWYYDSSERSEIREGTEAEIRGLFEH